MIEIEHADLFKPPEGTKAIVIPCCGEYWAKPPATYYTPMTSGYAKMAKARFQKLHINLGVLQWRMGVTPHPLTTEKTVGRERVRRIHLPGKQKLNLPLRYHLISLPTRRFLSEPIKADFLSAQLRALTLLIDGRLPWLAEGNVVLPQICDPEHDKAWDHFKPLVELWLRDERFVVITGKEGLQT